MKKMIIIFILLSALSLTVSAQDLDRMMADLAKVENVVRQVVNKDMLDTSMGEQKKDLPSFLKNITKIEVLALEDGNEEIKNNLIKEISSFKDGNGYETLLQVKDDEDNVHIISYKDENKLSHLYIIAIDEDDIAFIKMSGELSQQDMLDIVEQQQKNNK